MRMLVASMVACLAAGIGAYGQVGLGSISGQVTDPSGATVPGAGVVVENTETKAQTRAVAGSAGYYQALNLTPGIYTVSVENTGFNKSVREGVQVQVGDRLTLNFALVGGTSQQTVTVTAELPLLRTEDAQLGDDDGSFGHGVLLTNTYRRGLQGCRAEGRRLHRLRRLGKPE